MVDRRSTHARRPRSLRGGAAVRGLALALLVGLAAAPATGEEEGPPSPLPEGTVAADGAPPYWPETPSDPQAVRAWCERVTQHGRRLAGTRLGADLLYAGAHAYLHHLRAREAAFALYAEAAAAYPRDDPMQGMVQYHHAVWELGRGNVSVAAGLLAKVEAWARLRAPADLPPAEASRWDLVARLTARDLPLLRAKVAEAHGRFAEAAAIREALAVSMVEADQLADAAALREEAARLRHRAGDKAGARRTIEEALALTRPAQDRAWLELWLVYLEHGLLREDGSLGLWSTWPGEAFERDVRGALRGLQGHPHAGRLYLSIASGAFTAGRKAFALDVYELALGDRDLQAQARGDEQIWRGLLVAFPAALDLGRFEMAEHILGVVERIADQPIPEMDTYRVAMQQAREREAREEERERTAREQEARARAQAQRAAAEGPREPLGRLESGDEDAGAEDLAREPEEDVGPPVWIWILGLVALLGLVSIGVRVASRRSRRQTTSTE